MCFVRDNLLQKCFKIIVYFCACIAIASVHSHQNHRILQESNHPYAEYVQLVYYQKNNWNEFVSSVLQVHPSENSLLQPVFHILGRRMNSVLSYLLQTFQYSFPLIIQSVFLHSQYISRLSFLSDQSEIHYTTHEEDETSQMHDNLLL